MQIRAIKRDCFRLSGKEEKVLVNPDKELIDSGKCESRTVIFTRKEYDFLGLTFEGVVISGPGEYEVGGVEILGIDANGEGEEVVYVLNMDGLSLVIMTAGGDLLKDKLGDKINGIDVLVVLPSKEGTLDYKSVLEMAKKWGVNYLVPLAFEAENLKELLDAVDSEGLVSVEKIKIDKEN
ncbi:MBL fold metallo-hydrolase, partial [Patescibacteria group bacterium]|nr:MBL fold metallo-hydrolase [Patescibacteria group bacterium]